MYKNLIFYVIAASIHAFLPAPWNIENGFPKFLVPKLEAQTLQIFFRRPKIWKLVGTKSRP